MVLFEHPGAENTRAALALALDAANKHGLDIVVSTTGGGTVRPCWKWPGKGAIPAGSLR